MLARSELVDLCEAGLLVPWEPKNVGPASIDLTLGCDMVRVVKRGKRIVKTRMRNKKQVTIRKGEFWLMHTSEVVSVFPQYAADVTGRSSYGRKGLCVHATAGFIDPGFIGQITLEVWNESPKPVTLHVGDRVAQLRVYKLIGDPSPDYSECGRYQNQRGATESRCAK